MFWNQQEIGNKVSVRTVLPVQSNWRRLLLSPVSSQANEARDRECPPGGSVQLTRGGTVQMLNAVPGELSDMWGQLLMILVSRCILEVELGFFKAGKSVKSSVRIKRPLLLRPVWGVSGHLLSCKWLCCSS